MDTFTEKRHGHIASIASSFQSKSGSAASSSGVELYSTLDNSSEGTSQMPKQTAQRYPQAMPVMRTLNFSSDTITLTMFFDYMKIPFFVLGVGRREEDCEGRYEYLTVRVQLETAQLTLAPKKLKEVVKAAWDQWVERLRTKGSKSLEAAFLDLRTMKSLGSWDQIKAFMEGPERED